MNKQLIDVSLQGISARLYIDADDNDQMIVDEIWNLNVYRVLLPKRLSPTYVLDLGAHKGYFTVLCAAAGYRVTCFEPNPESFTWLRQNVEMNGLTDRVVWLNAGVAPEFGIMELLTNESSGCTGLVNFGSGNVKVWAFDAVLQMHQEWDIVKMDIESAETEVITVASDESLKRINYLAMETHAHLPKNIPLMSKLEPHFNLSWASEIVNGHDQMRYLYCARRT